MGRNDTNVRLHRPVFSRRVAGDLRLRSVQHDAAGQDQRCVDSERILLTWEQI